MAVLPFVNRSELQENRYFIDGVTDDIIVSLSRIGTLRVVSRTAASRYRTLSPTLEEIRQDLGVSHVLEGSVRQSGTRVRIVAQLFDAATGEHLWGDTYDRDMEDIFAIQSDVAQRIAAALETRLTRAERERIQRRPTESLTAYDLYLRGRFAWNQRTENSLRQSVTFFQQAIEEDPEFARALAGLADAYATLGIYGAAAPEEVMPAARENAERALAVDAGSAEALTSLGCVKALFEWDWEGAEAVFRRAVEADPGYAISFQWYSALNLTPLGRFRDAGAVLARAHELDPRSPVVGVTRGVLAFYSGQPAEAERHCREVLESHDRFGVAHYFLGQALQAQGRLEEAVSSLRDGVRHTGGSPETFAALGHALGMAGQREEARETLEALERRAALMYVSPVLIGRALVGLGEVEGALEQLEKGLAARASELAWLAVHPAYEPLHGDARFQALLARVGLPAPSTA